MKILYINELLNSSGGGSIHGRKIMEKLKSLDVSLFTMPAIRNEQTIKYRRNLIKTLMPNIPSVIREFLVFIKQNLKSFLRSIELYFALKRDKPDCILMRTELYDLTPIILKKISKIPLILEVNAPASLERKLDYETQNKKLVIPDFFSNLDTKIWESADAIYVVSNIIKKIIRSKLDNRSPFIEVIPNGVDIDYFENLDTKDSEEQSDFIKICFIGSFTSRHGVDLLLDAYEEIANLRPMTQLILIGDGVNRKNLENYVCCNRNLKGRVIFTGRLTHDNTMKRLTEMDILVAPYKYSDFFYFSPLKVFEYMASGKAIITSKFGQINEILEDGVNSVLINPKNKKEFSNALLTLIDSEKLRIKLGYMALQRAKKFSWKISAMKLLKLVQRTVTRRCAINNFE